MREELELVRWTNDTLPSSVLALDADGIIEYRNATTVDMVPTLTVGSPLREVLAGLTHEEKIDRLLIRREITTFRGRPDGPELHWIVWDGVEKDGRLVLTVWDTDWNDAMNERRAAFMMAASHELRSPLTALQGFAELLNMDTSNLSPEQVEAAEIIERTARHLTVLVQDVFDLSRNSFGELRLNLCDVDLGGVLEPLVTSASAVTEERGQTLTCEVEPGLPVIRADEARTIQMISNLVNNASFHNPAGTSIRVRAGVEGEHVTVEVSDDGDGLPFDDPDEAFRSFRRGAGVTAGDRTGSGIGLSVTKRLIQLHRGDIRVESDPGNGTSFTLLFPIDRENALTPGEPGPV